MKITYDARKSNKITQSDVTRKNRMMLSTATAENFPGWVKIQYGGSLPRSLGVLYEEYFV
jgi:hypothetical protein